MRADDGGHGDSGVGDGSHEPVTAPTASSADLAAQAATPKWRKGQIALVVFMVLYVVFLVVLVIVLASRHGHSQCLQPPVGCDY